VSTHHDDATTDGEAVPTVRERLRAAHISDERAHGHLQAGALTLDGDVVTDLDQPAPPGTRIVFTGR
jgi:hypothetical protein